MDKRFLKNFFRVFLILMAFVIFSVSLLKPAFAARQKKAKKKAEVPTVTQTQKKQELLKQAEEKLNNTAWQAQFTRISAATKKETYKDELEFIDKKFASRKLSKEGFSATSFTLNLKGENIIIWETMQTDAKGNLAFWKGEMEGERMRGVLSRQLKDKAAIDYTFVSISKEAITKEEAQKIEKQSQEVLEEKPAEPKIEEKKKRWFW